MNAPLHEAGSVATKALDPVDSPRFQAELLDAALELAGIGIAVFPCRNSGEKAKAPLTEHGWKDATTNADQIHHWWGREFPGAMIGAAMGDPSSGFVVVDVDAKPPAAGNDPVTGHGTLERMEALALAWPATPGVVTTPNGGMHLWFRATGSSPRKSKLPGIDLQGDGSYVIVPPSRMRGNPAPYAPVLFGGAKFIDVLAALPEPPEWFSRAAEIRSLLVGEPDQRPLPVAPDDRTSTQDFYRRLNEDALANLGTWIPSLGLARCRAEPDGSFRAVAEWRQSSTGRPIHKRSRNLSIDPRGIKDFGDGDRTYTALDLVMAARGIDLNAATVWLGEALGMDFSPSIVLKPKATLSDAPKADDMLEAEIASEPQIEAPRDALESLCENVPGLVGDMMDWIDESARQPCRALGLGPALTFIAALAGRHNAGPTNLRPNLYVVTLAKSGFGKDHARKCINDLVTVAGLDRWLGPEELMSDSGLREAVEQKPASVCMIDEFGGLIAKIMDRKAGQHQAGIRHMLLKLYTSSDSTYRGAAYAQRSANPIHNPCLSIYGTTTPHDFWPAMSAKGVGDGFLPRFLMLNVEGDPRKAINPKASRAPSQTLIDRCRALASRTSGNLGGAVGAVTPRVARWGHGAEAAFEAAEDECRARGAARKSDADVLWTRTMEQALKLAHIVALGVHIDEPVVITKELMLWAVSLATLSTRTFAAELNDRLANNDRQAEYLQIKRIIRSAGSDGITARVVGRKLNGTVDTRRRDDILRQLVEDGHATFEKVFPSGGGRPSDRYLPR